MLGSFYRLVRGAVSTEHIKYPDSSKPSQQNVTNGTNNTRKTSVTAQNSQPSRPGTQGSLVQSETGARSISPVQPQPSPDSEILRRTMSPTNASRTNDAQYTAEEKGKAPMRPKREEDNDLSDANRAAERAISPEQRARSPTSTGTSGVIRTVSPVQRQAFDDQPASMTSIAVSTSGGGGSGLATRSVSPPVDRSKPPPDAFYTSGRDDSPGTVTPQPNGHTHNSPSPSASSEDMKRREAWLKAALIRASRSGFIYADAQDPPEDLILDFANADQGETKRVVEMIMNLKHMRAAIQVRSRSLCFCSVPKTKT